MDCISFYAAWEIVVARHMVSRFTSRSLERPRRRAWCTFGTCTLILLRCNTAGEANREDSKTYTIRLKVQKIRKFENKWAIGLYEQFHEKLHLFVLEFEKKMFKAHTIMGHEFLSAIVNTKSAWTSVSWCKTFSIERLKVFQNGLSFIKISLEILYLFAYRLWKKIAEASIWVNMASYGSLTSKIHFSFNNLQYTRHHNRMTWKCKKRISLDTKIYGIFYYYLHSSMG